MKIKVCGMREATNIVALQDIQPDFMGFIFYDKSSRFANDSLDEELLKSFPKSIKKVGVFVNASIEYVLQKTKIYTLDYAQLHGDETPDYCRSLRSKGVNIIRAFSVDNDFVFSRLNNFKPHVDYFLFDAKGENPGGNGIIFDWNILKKYENDKPYFLAGGIELEYLPAIEGIVPQPYCIDINSKFEKEPAIKDIEKIGRFIASIRGK